VRDAEEHPLADAAVEALGGTPASLQREPASPVRFVLPKPLSRQVGRFDHAVDGLFERHLRGRPAPDKVFYAASALGDFSLLWHLVATARALRSEADERGSARLAAALAVESLAVNWGVKSLFRRARPEWEQHRPRTLRKPRTSSFPSGHASSGFLAASLLAHRSRAPLAWYGLAAVVASSRVHVRIHHASDVVGGALLGLAVGRLVRRVWPLREG
jgi:membrane-associated phospholipid phosphatase